MSEYPAFRPWWLGGDPWLTDDELAGLLDLARRRNEARRQQNKAGGRGRRRGRRGR